MGSTHQIVPVVKLCLPSMEQCPMIRWERYNVLDEAEMLQNHIKAFKNCEFDNLPAAHPTAVFLANVLGSHSLTSVGD